MSHNTLIHPNLDSDTIHHPRLWSLDSTSIPPFSIQDHRFIETSFVQKTKHEQLDPQHLISPILTYSLNRPDRLEKHQSHGVHRLRSMAMVFRSTNTFHLHLEYLMATLLEFIHIDQQTFISTKRTLFQISSSHPHITPLLVQIMVLHEHLVEELSKIRTCLSRLYWKNINLFKTLKPYRQQPPRKPRGRPPKRHIHHPE